MDPVTAEPTRRLRPGPDRSDPLQAPSTAPSGPPRELTPVTTDDARRLLPQVATRFLGFEIVAELGRGTSGCVYLARQGDLADRLVALKVTTDEFDESRALAQLQHTNVVPIYSVHRIGPLCAVCMPYFGSVTLANVLRDLIGRSTPPVTGKDLLGALYARRAAGIPAAPKATGILRMLESLGYVDACLWVASRLADGLAHAHDRGILHLDLKPANVLLTDEGQPMLLDFNMAQDTKHGLVSDGVGGTFQYMAPEHLAAFGGDTATVDARADVFSLGVILFELLARRRPYPASTPGSDNLPVLIAARRAGPVPLRCFNRAVSPAVGAIVHKCLAAAPADRYQSAQELAEDLRRQLSHRPLQHAAEPSVSERVKKWVQRNPRLASALMAGAAAAALAAVLVR